MGFRVAFTIEGETQLSRNFARIAGEIKDWTPAFAETATTLKDIFSGEVFDSEGVAIDTSWAPLSDKYKKIKDKKYPGKGILEATGTMRNGFVALWRSDMAEVRNDTPYFKFHQSNQPRTKIPRRVMMKLAENQREQVVKIFQIYFQQIVKAI